MNDAALPLKMSPSVAAPLRGSESRGLPRVRRWGGRWYAKRVLQNQISAVAERHFIGSDNGCFVDYGCGEMPYRSLFEPRVERYVGLDLPGNARADGVINASGRAELPDASARWVLSTQVLEHAPDPAAYLAECHRMLEPGGRLLLSTHGHWRFHPHPDDFWRWTSQGLRQILRDAGFVIESWSGVLGLGGVGTLMLQDAVVQRLPRPMRGAIATGFQWACAAADRLHPAAARDQDAAIYVVVASKADADATDEAFQGERS